MSKQVTEKVWKTLRHMSVYAHEYRHNFSEVAMSLIKEVPWYDWPKTDEVFYDSVLCLAYYSQGTVDAWNKKHPECVYGPRFSNDAWYWIASWASTNPLDYYLEE